MVLEALFYMATYFSFATTDNGGKIEFVSYKFMFDTFHFK